MTEKPEASVLTARRAAQLVRLSSADDACEHLYILIVRSSLGPSPPNAGRYTVASRFRCRTYARGYIFPRAPERFVASPLCLVGYVRWQMTSRTTYPAPRGGTNGSRIGNLGLAANDPDAVDRHGDLHTVPLSCLYRRRREAGQNQASGTSF